MSSLVFYCASFATPQQDWHNVVPGDPNCCGVPFCRWLDVSCCNLCWAKGTSWGAGIVLLSFTKLPNFLKGVIVGFLSLLLVGDFNLLSMGSKTAWEFITKYSLCTDMSWYSSWVLFQQSIVLGSSLPYYLLNLYGTWFPASVGSLQIVKKTHQD